MADYIKLNSTCIRSESSALSRLAFRYTHPSPPLQRRKLLKNNFLLISQTRRGQSEFCTVYHGPVYLLCLLWALIKIDGKRYNSLIENQPKACYPPQSSCPESLRRESGLMTQGNLSFPQCIMCCLSTWVPLYTKMPCVVYRGIRYGAVSYTVASRYLFTGAIKS